MTLTEATKASWRFQSIIRATDTMTEERLMYLCFEATDEEFDKAIEELGGKVVRYKDNPNLTPVNGINIIKSVMEETPVLVEGVWRKEKEQ